jgi:predicted Zn-dependent protease
MLTQDEAQKLAKKVLGMSTFPECQVTITSQEQAYTRFANNGITTASFSLRNNLSIVTTRDARTGSYATNDLDDDSLRAAVKKAEELAALTPPNSERLSPVGPQQFPKTFDFDEQTANARSPEMIPHVKTIIDAAMKEKLVGSSAPIASPPSPTTRVSSDTTTPAIRS